MSELNSFLGQIQSSLIASGRNPPDWPSTRDDNALESAAAMIGGLLDEIEQLRAQLANAHGLLDHLDAVNVQREAEAQSGEAVAECIVASAFMAGQISCGVDPSWSSAKEYVEATHEVWTTSPPAAKVPELKFPTMLRKMWSGTEVQEWIDKALSAQGEK